MHVVALTSLASPIETEAAALAVDLGTTAYEERLKLVGGLPAIVLTSADGAKARDLCAKLRARGQGAVACDADQVIPNEQMISLRRFAFDPGAIVATDLPDARLPYDDILALLRASHLTRTETRTETTSKEFSAGRAILSGGLMLRKKVTREEKNVSTEREQLLYVFRASGGTPFVLRERGTQYSGLGAAAGPSSAQNFLATVAKLRQLAPTAVYDEHLMQARSAPSRSVRTGVSGAGSLAVSSASGVDLMAHVTAMWIRESSRR